MVHLLVPVDPPAVREADDLHTARGYKNNNKLSAINYSEVTLPDVERDGHDCVENDDVGEEHETRNNSGSAASSRCKASYFVNSTNLNAHSCYSLGMKDSQGRYTWNS